MSISRQEYKEATVIRKRTRDLSAIATTTPDRQERDGGGAAEGVAIRVLEEE